MKHNFHPNNPGDQDDNGLLGWFILFHPGRLSTLIKETLDRVT